MFDLSIIVPCYNEASRGDLSTRITTLLDYLESKSYLFSYEVLFINDGSKDDTLKVLKSFQSENIHILNNTINCGKGYCIKRAIAVSDAEYCFFMDADLSVPIEFIERFYELRDEKRIVIGSRYTMRVNQGIIRKFISKLAHSLTVMSKKKLGLTVYDTQCGFKLFSTSAAVKIIDYSVCDNWLFDIELLSYGQALDLKIQEFDVPWYNSLKSTLNPIRGSLVSGFELLKILRTITKNKSLLVK